MCVHEIDQLLCDAVVHVEYLICIHALQNRNQCSKKVQILLNVERYARIRYIVKYAMTILWGFTDVKNSSEQGIMLRPVM